MTSSWSQAGDVLAGRDFEELLSWVERNFPDRSLEHVRSERKRTTLSIDRIVAEIIVGLDPDSAPIFLGERVDIDALIALPARAGSDTNLFSVVEKLWSSRALRAFASLEGHGDLALVDTAWQDHHAVAIKWFADVKEAGAMTRELLALMLGAAAKDVKAKVKASGN